MGRLPRVLCKTRNQDVSGHPATFSLEFSPQKLLWTQVGDEAFQLKAARHWFLWGQ